MSLFGIAAAGVAAGGIGVAAWLLWPGERSGRAKKPAPDGTSDLPARVGRLRQAPFVDRPATDLGREPMVPEGPRRVPEVSPADVLLWAGAWLVPLSAALLRTPEGAGEVLRGRRQGRAFCLVKLRDGLHLDLVEVGRVLPAIAVEAAARGVDLTELRIDDRSEAQGMLAAWIAGLDAPRVVPEGQEHARVGIALEGGHLEVRYWVPAVAEGLRDDQLAWAAHCTWSHGQTRVSDCGATPPEILERLGAERGESAESWRWSRTALAELVAVGNALSDAELAIEGFLDDVFADGAVPIPDLHDEAQALTAAATLNWRAVQLRRAGRVREAIAWLRAAEATAAPGDDDNRADMLFNQGYCWLQLAFRTEAPGLEPLREAERCFTLSARHNPRDPHAWANLALIHEVSRRPDAARDAWQQAATRAWDPELRDQLMANARAVQ